MNLAEEMPVSRVREKVTEAEWEARVNLAAAYRLVALYGWDELVFTHISIANGPVRRRSAVSGIVT